MEDTKAVVGTKEWETSVRVGNDHNRYGVTTERKLTQFRLLKWSDGNYSLTVTVRCGGMIRDSRSWGNEDAIRFCRDLGVELI